LPSIDWRAFTSEYLLEYTLGGYVRILAVMTGIEVFANLVAAYEGKREEKSRKAFGSLLIIMGTTSLTMLIVGPAILQLSDPTDPTVSVFTQTMDQLLPAPLPWLGTLVGVAVLLSASAAAAQGVQNLALGLKYRRYVPEFLGRKNRFEVAAAPVWIQVFLIVVCFLAFGTHEETYLAIYAAGVFVLLSMTGWAAAKRLIREMRTHFSPAMLAVLLGTISAAVLTTGATIIIFGERFTEGAWTYLLFIPVLYILFSFFRRRLGDPPQMEERWGRLVVERKYLPVMQPFTQAENQPSLQNLLIPLDGSYLAEEALQLAQPLTAKVAGQVRLLSVDPDRRRAGTVLAHNGHDLETYLSATVQQLGRVGVRAEFDIASGNVAETISTHAANQNMDLIVISTHGRSGVQRFLLGSVAGALMQQSPVPLLITRPGGMKATAAQGPVAFRRLMVTLDGSEAAENILPYITPLASAFDSEIILLSVPDGVDNEDKNQYIKNYLEGMAASFTGEGLRAQPVITGFELAQTIVEYGITHKVDLIMMATHGRGGMERFMLGSVADRVVRQATCPVFLVPVR
jgi:nucleotide-binding universal stress UspA family protein